MKPKPFLTSIEWVSYFHENAQTATTRPLPESEPALSTRLREILRASLPAWQLGKTSEGNHLRKAARQYAETQHDPAFVNAVELFIREEQRHGQRLGEWLDRAGIPRCERDWGDSLFRFCRYAIPNYAVWASVVVMVETMAEIYYAAVRRITPCPRLRAECSRILADELKHIQFQCEHLAATRRDLPRWLREIVHFGESLFFIGVSGAVWIGHGRLIREADISFTQFIPLAWRRYRLVQKMMDPAIYDFDLPGQYEKWRRRLLTATD